MTKSSKKTGNESVADIDPGGTRPAAGNSRQPDGNKVEQHVETGDRNVRPEPETKPDI
jgi:hypothetical protein